ncbi:MAG: hypothetical protein ACLR6J_08215 [Parabacteroides merdae]
MIFYGEGGALETGHNGYRIFDMKNKLVKELASKDVIDLIVTRTVRVLTWILGHIAGFHRCDQDKPAPEWRH